MKSFYFILFFLCASLSSHAQLIKVLSKISEEPILNVAIYNVDKTKSVVTNFRGEAQLDEFSDSEVIYFKHLSHVLKKITKLQLKGVNKIYLESNTTRLG